MSPSGNPPRPPAPVAGPSTLAVHGGEQRGEGGTSGPLEPPIVLSSAFAFESAAHAAGAFSGENDAYIYGRWGNPSVEHVERKIAALEGAEDAAVAASGMASISGALLAVLEAGDHIVASRALYGETARLLRERLPRLGITTTFVDDTSADGYLAAFTPRTRLLYVETPSNPTLAVTDIRAVAALASEASSELGAKIYCFCDNTFATPFCQRPLALGADLSLHSATKFLSGHGDVIAGAAAGSRALVERVREATIKGFGGALSPFSAYLLARGIRTFALRMARSTATASRLARFLEEHPAVARVHHPSLASHPGHAVAAAQMSAPPALVSFEVRGGLDVGRRVLEGVRLITHAVSLGDCRTLITHPASTTASTMPEPDRARAGITDGLLRVAVGIEDDADLIDDLGAALQGAIR
jgi:methionine-gamma-lyase